MKKLILLIVSFSSLFSLLHAQEFADFQITATNQGTGTFLHSALSNFTWEAEGTINGAVQIRNNEEFDDGNEFENIFGQADNAENLRIQIYPNGPGTDGTPILSKDRLTINFNKVTPVKGWGFCVVDIDVEHCLISAIDEFDNKVSIENINDWLVELFDTDTIGDGLNIPKWDSTHAALLGFNTSEDYVEYDNLVIGGLIDSEAPAAFFMPDIPLKTLIIDHENLQSQAYVSYHFYIASLPSDDATLSNIQVNSEDLPGFIPTTLDYEVELPYGTTIVPVITAIPTDSTASVIITQAPNLPGTATILVTAEDSVTQQTYSVEFTIAPNNVASLSNILIDDVDLTGFVPTTLDYNTELPYGSTIAPTVSATPIDSNATVVITPAPELPGTATILVTAEDGNTQQSYSVEFTVALNTDATLSGIQINSEDLLVFNTDTLNYTVELPTWTTTIPFVDAILTDESAEINIIQANEIPGTATITVTAEDGTTQIIYTISFSFVTGLSDFNLKNSLKLYPNPTEGMLKIQYSMFKVAEGTIELYDLNGRKFLVKHITAGTETVEINVSNLQSGLYYCKILSDNKQQVIKKWVKK